MLARSARPHLPVATLQCRPPRTLRTLRFAAVLPLLLQLVLKGDLPPSNATLLPSRCCMTANAIPWVRSGPMYLPQLSPC